jgi:tetratricopeptide (TPR) repeat protein
MRFATNHTVPPAMPQATLRDILNNSRDFARLRVMTGQYSTLPSAKLNSWKEIANYLQREVRTVQRWEKEAGLPVRRLLHEKRGTVYAFTKELDAWIASRSPVLANLDAANASAGNNRFTSRVYVAAAAICIFAIALIIFVRSSGRTVKGAALAVASAPSRAAREAYLRGLYYQNRGTGQDIQESIRYFQKALAADANYAPAYAAISESYTTLGASGDDAPAALVLAGNAADRAVALDDSLAEAHEARAVFRAYGQWNWRGASEEYGRALRLNPNLAGLHSSYAQFSALLGNSDVAIVEARRAREMEPLSATDGADLGWYYYWARRYEEALAISREVLRSEPKFYSAQNCVVRTLVAQKKFGEARAEIKHQLREAGENEASIRYLDDPSAEKAVREYYARKLAKLRADPRTGVSSFDIALALAALNRKEELLACLEDAFSRHEFVVLVLNVEPFFDAFRGDPRFMGIISKVGLPRV